MIAAYPLTKDVASSVQSVPYLAPEEIVLGRVSNPASFKFKKLSDLCVHTVGVRQGSAEDTALRKIKCVRGQKVTIKELPDADAVANALALGRVDATYQDSPTSVYYKRIYRGSFMKLGETQRIKEEGILIRIGDSGILNTIQAAFHAVVQYNMYNNLLEMWGLTNDALPPSELAAINQRWLYA